MASIWSNFNKNARKRAKPGAQVLTERPLLSDSPSEVRRSPRSVLGQLPRELLGPASWAVTSWTTKQADSPCVATTDTTTTSTSTTTSSDTTIAITTTIEQTTCATSSLKDRNTGQVNDFVRESVDSPSSRQSLSKSTGTGQPPGERRGGGRAPPSKTTTEAERWRAVRDSYGGRYTSRVTPLSVPATDPSYTELNAAGVPGT